MFFLLFASITGWLLWSIYTLLTRRRFSIAGKTVLVTGGTSLVGRCLVVRLLQMGANVVVWDLSNSRLEELAKEAARLGIQRCGAAADEMNLLKNSPRVYTCTQPGNKSGSLTTSVVDLSSRIQLQRAVGKLEPVHILLNVAEDSSSQSFFDRTDDSSERLLLSSVLSPLLLAKALLPGMLRQPHGSHIVTVINKAGLLGAATQPDYAASQWASIGAHESIQMAIRQEGGCGKVRATLVCSGTIAKPSTNATLPSSRRTTTTTTSTGFDEPTGRETSKHLTLPTPCRLLSFASSSVMPEEVAEGCIWAICHGVERVYIPCTFVLFPLLRVLPVPWFLWLASPVASRTPLSNKR